MTLDGVYKRLSRQTADHIVCIICERVGMDQKYKRRAGFSNFGRHLRTWHAKELAEVRLRVAMNAERRIALLKESQARSGNVEPNIFQHSGIQHNIAKSSTATKSSQPPPLHGMNTFETEGCSFGFSSLNAPSTTAKAPVPFPSNVTLSQSHDPTATIEELTAQQNNLLMQIVDQNQKMLEKTNEILYQNQQLMQLLINNHLMGHPGDLKLNVNGEDEVDIKEEDNEDENDNSQGIAAVEEENPLVGIEDPVEIKIEPQSEGEEMEENDVKMEEIELFIPEISMEPVASTSKSNPPISGIVEEPPVIKAKKKLSKVATPLTRRGNDIEMNAVIHLLFPITSVGELRAIDRQMNENQKFKESILDFIRKIKLRGEDTSQLVERHVLELKVNEKARKQSNFIAILQKPLA